MNKIQERGAKSSGTFLNFSMGQACSPGTPVAFVASMPRTPRIDFPGAFHHVYARGIEKRIIFSDDADRRELRRRVAYNLSRFRASCLAWAFMTNHFHLLFHSSAGNLPEFMRCLMSGYAMYFNRKTGRVGHLFQNRYKSSLIDSEPYLLELIRYIHLNPIRSGTVSSLEELAAHRWTGHWEIARKKRFPWEEFPFVRDFFSGGQGGNGLARYLGFLEDGIKNRPTVKFSDGEGGKEYLAPLFFDGLAVPDIPDKQQSLFEEVVRTACRDRGYPVDRLLGGPRNRIVTEVRKNILKVCVLDHGMARKAVSSWLGITDAGGAYLLKGVESGSNRDEARFPKKVEERP